MTQNNTHARLEIFFCMTPDTTISSTLLTNERPPAVPPVIVIQNHQLELVRGKPLWVYIFRMFSLVIPGVFGYLVYSMSESDRSTRGIDAFMAMLLCSSVFWVSQSYLTSHAQNEALSSSLSIQFFFRGASVSIFLAVMLESLGMVSNRPRFVTWKDLPIAVTVGFAEEVSKLLVVVLGTFLVPSNLPEALILNQSGDPSCMRCFPLGSCIRLWTTLVDSPRALAMAGISVGFGFMFSENLEYFFLVFTSMDSSTRLITMGLRILLNLHPILTGLSATRLANSIWTSSQPKSISIGKLASCIWPSVVMHALFDFGLMFTATNPDLGEQDVMFIIASVSIIPIAMITLWKTYRRLPYVLTGRQENIV